MRLRCRVRGDDVGKLILYCGFAAFDSGIHQEEARCACDAAYAAMMWGSLYCIAASPLLMAVFTRGRRDAPGLPMAGGLVGAGDFFEGEGDDKSRAFVVVYVKACLAAEYGGKHFYDIEAEAGA